mgnify:CR=1 FL=1
MTTAGIVGVLIFEAIEFLRVVPLFEFLTGVQWTPLFSPPSFGVLPLVAGTTVISLIAMLIALPIGLLAHAAAARLQGNDTSLLQYGHEQGDGYFRRARAAFLTHHYATPVDMAKELLTLRGESTMALSPASLVTRALHTTSDFPIILGNTVGRVLRDAYQAAPSGIRRLGRQTSARDFRSVNKIMLGEAPLLEKLNEHGEIKAGTMAEAREAYKIETWAKKIGITRQVLVNDDLGAFSDLARRMGQAAAETEAVSYTHLTLPTSDLV